MALERWGVNRFGRYRRPNPRGLPPKSPLFLRRMRAGACFLLFQTSTCAAAMTHLRRLVCVCVRERQSGTQSCPPPSSSCWPAYSLTHPPVISHRWRWLFDFTCPGYTPERTHLFPPLSARRLFPPPFHRSSARTPGWQKAEREGR